MNDRQTINHALRAEAGQVMTEVLRTAEGLNELGIADRLLNSVRSIPATLADGWYDPPAHGVAVLIGETKDDFERTRFDTLRKPEFAPSTAPVFTNETPAIVYASPIATGGMIGDWGLTIYAGTDTLIRQHFSNCLAAVEAVAEYARLGMTLGDISQYAGLLIAEKGLTNGRTILTNASSATGVNCGHTIPWSDTAPTEDELATIQSSDQQSINQLISSKRAFINEDETTLIEGHISFTTELRLESVDDPTLPNVFFHLLVSFGDGEKIISSNYSEAFAALGMDYLHSKY
jgi:hypothetical protein